MKSLEKVNFQMIRYANCWEDADLLLQGFDAKAGGSHLSIGSAGDNSFSLLTTNPEKVVAIDISPVQIYLVELKKAAIRKMSREEYLHFAGFTGNAQDANRWLQYCSICDKLSPGARQFWNQNRVAICDGIIYSGKFESYFRLFSKWILPLIHRSKTIDKLLANKSESEQKIFYRERWNTSRWKWLFRMFFSRKLMGWLGRDPAFLQQVEISVANFIFNKAEEHLSSIDAQKNHILDFALTGRFKNNLPHYVRPGHYEKVRENLDQLICRVGPAESAITEFGSFDYFNLSNIFEYLSEAHFSKVAQELMAGANSGAKMAYWNLMVERKISTICPELKMEKSNRQMYHADKGFFYHQFLVERKVA